LQKDKEIYGENSFYLLYRGEGFDIGIKEVLVARPGQDEDGGLQHHAPTKICHLDIKKAFI
jgi:hypothetical protein